jgi:hypothetical protein
MKLATPTAGIAVGGIVTGGALVGLKLGVKLDPAKAEADQKGKAFVVHHAAKLALGLGLAASGVLAATGRKQAAVASAITATAVGLPAVAFEVKKAMDDKKAAAQLPAAPAPAAGETHGFGIAVAEARRGFGAPAVELFASAPTGVELLGTPSSQSQQSFSPAAFGGGVF